MANSFVKLQCNLTNGFEGGPRPLTKPRPIGAAHSKRKIPNFAGTSLPKELTGNNFNDPLKLIGLNPRFNYTVI